MSWTNLKYELIRTPLEKPIAAVRGGLQLASTIFMPEMASLRSEDLLISKVLRRAITPSTNAIDVGAHYGHILSSMLRYAPDGQHHAIEAIPSKAAFLRRKFPEVQIHQVALGVEDGNTEFFVNRSRSGYSSMRKNGSDQDEYEKINVAMTKLDSLVASVKGRIDFMKVDVEGAEEFVFQGATEFLKEHQPTILFECTPQGPKIFNRTPADLFDTLDNAKYEVRRLGSWLHGGPTVDRAAFSRAMVFPFEAMNWVASPLPS